MCCRMPQGIYTICSKSWKHLLGCRKKLKTHCSVIVTVKRMFDVNCFWCENRNLWRFKNRSFLGCSVPIKKVTLSDRVFLRCSALPVIFATSHNSIRSVKVGQAISTPLDSFLQLFLNFIFNIVLWKSHFL